MPEEETQHSPHLPQRIEQKNLSLQLLKSIPEEDVWLAGQLSPHTRRAYKADVQHFVRILRIRSAEELRQVGRAAVIHWQNRMKEMGTKPRTIRRDFDPMTEYGFKSEALTPEEQRASAGKRPIEFEPEPDDERGYTEKVTW